MSASAPRPTQTLAPSKSKPINGGSSVPEATFGPISSTMAGTRKVSVHLIPCSALLAIWAKLSSVTVMSGGSFAVWTQAQNQQL